MTVANMLMIQAAPAVKTTTGKAAGRADMGDFAGVFSEKLAQKQSVAEKPHSSAPHSEKPKTESSSPKSEASASESSSTPSKIEQSAQSNEVKPVDSQLGGEKTLGEIQKDVLSADHNAQPIALVEAGELLSTLELLRSQTLETRPDVLSLQSKADVTDGELLAEFDEEVATLLGELSDENLGVIEDNGGGQEGIALPMQTVAGLANSEEIETPKEMLATTTAGGREVIETQKIVRVTAAGSMNDDKLSNDGKLLAAADMKLKAVAFSDEKVSAPASSNSIAAMVSPLAMKATEAVTPTLAASQIPQLPVHTPMTANKWSQEIGTNLMIMASRRLDMAQMAITPPHLGPIDVALKVHQDQASVLFVAATPQAKEALEQSLPRLAAMLSENGLQLNDAHVSSGDSQEQRHAEQQAFLAQHAGEGRDDLTSGERFIDVAHTLGIPVERESAHHTEDLVQSTASMRRQEVEPGRVSFFA